MLFVVKPFIGFSMIAQLSQLKQTDSIIVKVFSKRKPEFLVEADDKKTAVAQQLNLPPAKLLLAFSALLAAFFPLIIGRYKITARYLHQLSLKVLPDEQTYLLTGKLTI